MRGAVLRERGRNRDVDQEVDVHMSLHIRCFYSMPDGRYGIHSGERILAER
jgi:hypothetical protein